MRRCACPASRHNNLLVFASKFITAYLLKCADHTNESILGQFSEVSNDFTNNTFSGKLECLPMHRNDFKNLEIDMQVSSTLLFVEIADSIVTVVIVIVIIIITVVDEGET